MRGRGPGADVAILAPDGRPGRAPLVLLADPLPALGDEVWAVGYPPGLPNASEGAIGARPKTSEFPDPYRSFLAAQPIPVPDDVQWLQVDRATIRPGSSGGPLIDAAGRVVGMNSWLTGTRDFGFAVSTRHVAKVLQAAQQRSTPMPLPLPPVQGEPAMGWLHPEIARIIAKERKSDESPDVAVGRARDGLWTVAQKEPGSWASLQALLLIGRSSAGQKNPQEWFNRATRNLLAHHAAAPDLAVLALEVSPLRDPAVAEYCRRLLAHPESTEPAKAAACLALLNHLFFELQGSQGAKVNDLKGLREEIARALDQARDKLAAQSLVGLQIPSAPPTVAGALEEVVQGGQQAITLGTLEVALRYRFNHLSIGSLARDFGGKNLDGKLRRLSGLRGSVVMLDFFADWCGPCRSLYEHERKLVENYRSRPFAMVGVTSDDPDLLRKRVQEGTITWHLCLDRPDEGAGNNQGIAQMYRVNSVPNIFLIDGDGYIRYRFTGAGDATKRGLEKAIQTLIKEADGGEVGVRKSAGENRHGVADERAVR